MSCVCTQELPDKISDNYFSFSQPCPVQTTVIVSRCECQEDRIRQMEVRRTHRKGRMTPLRLGVWRSRGARLIYMDLGLKDLAWMEMSFMGLVSYHLVTEQIQKLFPPQRLRVRQRVECSCTHCPQLSQHQGLPLNRPRILDVGG